VILVCAATEFELACYPDTEGVLKAVTGVGIAQTFLRLPKLLEKHRPERVWNIGIAGAYPDCSLKIGDLVRATSEVFGDVGFEQPDGSFQPIQTSAFGGGYEALELSLLLAPHAHPTGAGCTVNACTGTRATGEFRRDFFRASFETMEGAAVALVCQSANVPVSELRAISNIAAERDMRPENIQLAVKNLREALKK
jgi:futalosine hydrolase